MRCALMDSLVWVFPDTAIGSPPTRRIEVDVARGGTAAVTILMKETVPGTRIRVSVGPRPGRGWQFFRLRDVPVESNTGPDGFTEEGKRNRFVTRRAPFRVYDAMQPVDKSFEAASSTEAVRVHLRIPAGAKPGKRAYTLNITHAGETHQLELRVVVHGARIPPVGRKSWPVTNWFNYTTIAARHGLKPWSKAHWDMLTRYGQLMAHGRQNTFWFMFSDVFTLRRGKPTLNAPRLRRIVETFTHAGLHYIEGGHFGTRSEPKWTCPTFGVSLTGRRATSPEGAADIAAMAQPLMAEIDRNGWRGRYLQHVTDEPIEQNAVDYRIYVGIVRKYMPGIPILEATMHTSLAGSVDIWCPQAQAYQQKRAHFEHMRSVGDRVWFYTCCAPGGPWLNRLLDMELLRPALFGWAAALFRLDGFLHWGLNRYQSNQDPFEMSVIPNWGGGTHCLPPGDTHVVYPGDDGPWSSVRFESQREGLEDLELLRRLQQTHPRKASALIRSVIRGFDEYTTDVKRFRASRRTLLRAVSGAN